MSEMRRQLERYRCAPISRFDDGSVSCAWCLPLEFCGFDGHFPGFAIVPAVVQVLMAQMLAQQGLAQACWNGTIQRGKFLRQIRPGETITAVVRRRDIRQRHYIDARLEVDGAAAATMLLQLDEE